MAEQELRSKVRDILMLEGDMEHLERQKKVLLDRCVSISKDNTELQNHICEEEESARMAQAGFNTYRNKMEGHRAAVLHAARQTEAHKELEEKRALVRMLIQKKEQLKEDLENPNGNTVHMAKVEKLTLNYTEILNKPFLFSTFTSLLFYSQRSAVFMTILFFCICFSAERA